MKLSEYTDSTWREIAETWRDNIENKSHDLISEDGWKPMGTGVLGAALLEGYDEVAQLEEENAALKRENDELRGKAQAVVDGATGGGFDKFSGFDDYIIPYRLVDELADALLTAEESE